MRCALSCSWLMAKGTSRPSSGLGWVVVLSTPSIWSLGSVRAVMVSSHYCAAWLACRGTPKVQPSAWAGLCGGWLSCWCPARDSIQRIWWVLNSLHFFKREKIRFIFKMAHDVFNFLSSVEIKTGAWKEGPLPHKIDINYDAVKDQAVHRHCETTKLRPLCAGST